MTDPFDIEAHPPCLMNISTGMHVTCFQFWLWDRAIKIHRLSYRESTLNKVSALFFTFVHSREQRILYFSGSMHACEMQIWWNHNRSYQSRNCFQTCSGFG
jgi:hypothetical protein